MDKGVGIGEVIALHKALGSGGGSSGGGALVATDTDGTLDKTWQEIHDALLTGGAIILQVDGQDAYCYTVFSVTKAPGESSFDVVAGSIVLPSDVASALYSASSASGYPVYVDA